jgi:hypothetical protein
MDDDESFELVLQSLRGHNKRDPRSVRLAAVTAAIIEIVGDDLSPAKVYASTVTTLEGTLKLEGADSLSTQVALLELLKSTVPHVSPAALTATLSVSSRVLRAVVSSCQSVGSEDPSETKDELGGINATLRSACRAVTEILRQIPPTANEKLVRQFFHGTLLNLFDDRRPKVRKATQNGIAELLMVEKRHAGIRQALTDFSHQHLDRARKGKGDNASLLHLFCFLERVVLSLDVEKLGADLMELLMGLMQVEASSANDFVASFRKDATAKVMLINALLSVLIIMLEDEDYKHKETLDAFTARVLASVLQAKPSLVFQSANPGLLETGRALYGRLVLVAESRVIASNPPVGLKLLPLSIQMAVQLSRPTDETPAMEVAQAVMVELTKLFRERLGPVVDSGSHSSDVDIALKEGLRGMEQVLQHTFRPTWSVSLQPLAYLLQLMPSHVELPEIVESLIKLRIHVAEDDRSRQAIEESVSALIQGVGIEAFWGWICWEDAKTQAKSRTKEQGAVISTNRAWLLPVLKSSSMAVQTRQPHLAFFQQEMLGMARKCDAFAAAHPSDAAFHRARVADLWSLFPCFALNPADLPATLPDLAQILVRAMGDTRYPQLVTVICGGLKTLATGVLERRCRSDQGQQEAVVLAELSTKLLPALFKLVETLNGTATVVKSSPKDDMDVDDEEEDSKKNVQSLEAQRVQNVTEAIAELSRLAPKPYLQGLFKKVMQRLLAATQSEENEAEKICTFLGLCQALVSSEALDEASISLLYRAAKPLIRSDEHEPRVQKRAYKVLVEICSQYPSFVTEPDRLNELTELLVGSIMTCQVSARHMRLKCMALIVDQFNPENKQHMDIVPKVVGEVLLCLKDSNAKTREAGYQLLLKMGTRKDKITEYFHIVMAALGAQTPHMRSAAVMAMSRLVFEHARNDPSVHALLPSLLQTVIVLFDENSREVIKSVVGFVRVSVAAMTPEQLEPTLPDLVNGLLKYHKGKDRFRAKIKIILKKLVRVYGYEKLVPMVPASDTRLLTHMRKLSARAERRKAADRADGKPESGDFEDLMESDEEDSDDGKTLMTGATGFTMMTGRTGKTVRTAAIERSEKRSVAASTVATNRTQGKNAPGPRLKKDDGDVLDMLDPSMAKSVRFAEEIDDYDSDDGAMEFDDIGRLVVPDDFAETVTSSRNDDLEIDEENEQIKAGGKRRKLNKFESAKVDRDEKQKVKQQKKSVQSLGAAYKSKKAGGDVMKKGQKFEPYAYVPLDGKSYTKKNRRGAVDKMATIVRGGGKRKR